MERRMHKIMVTEDERVEIINALLEINHLYDSDDNKDLIKYLKGLGEQALVELPNT